MYEIMLYLKIYTVYPPFWSFFKFFRSYDRAHRGNLSWVPRREISFSNGGFKFQKQQKIVVKDINCF